MNVATLCDRCHQPTRSTIMSYFNTDSLCSACTDRERAHPRFKEAQEAEERACREGNFNFAGIGLPEDLRSHDCPDCGPGSPDPDGKSGERRACANCDRVF
jgi:hypothetical protein